jgi:hypothetical protein
LQLAGTNTKGKGNGWPQLTIRIQRAFQGAHTRPLGAGSLGQRLIFPNADSKHKLIAVPTNFYMGFGWTAGSSAPDLDY